MLKNYTQCHLLLSQIIDILNLYQDHTIGQLLKYFHYDRLLIELYEALLRQTYADNNSNLWEKCQSFLTENHGENGN